ERALALPEYRFYVALIHPGNTSPKSSRGAYWSRWRGDIAEVMGEDLAFYGGLAAGRASGAAGQSQDGPVADGGAASRSDGEPATRSLVRPAVDEPAPTYTIVMVAHNALEMTRLATLRTLRHSAGQDA